MGLKMSSASSNQIRKSFLHLPELADPKPEEKSDNCKTQAESGPVQRALSPQDAPPETVNHPHHGVGAV